MAVGLEISLVGEDRLETLESDEVLGRKRIPNLLETRDERMIEAAGDGSSGGKIAETQTFL
jgi:hypothetical protein